MYMIDSKIQQQLADGSVWTGRAFTHPHDGLKYALLTAGADRAAFVEALRQRLGSSDRRQRTGAIALLPEFIGDIGAERALAALHSMPLEAGEKPAWRIQYADLQQAAAVAIASRMTAADTHAQSWIKGMVISDAYRVFLLPHVARVDPDWVLANATLVRHRDLAVLAALPTDRRAALIAALAPWPPEKPSVLTRAFWKKLPPAEAARLRGLIWPANGDSSPDASGDSITYSAGGEFNPSDPFGAETLTLTPDGRFAYERRWQGQAWSRKGRADAAVLTGLRAALSAAGFPAVPRHNIPPGASLITLSSGSKQASMDYYHGLKFSGYNDAIRVADGWCRWLRKPNNPAPAPAGLHLDD